MSSHELVMILKIAELTKGNASLRKQNCDVSTQIENLKTEIRGQENEIAISAKHMPNSENTNEGLKQSTDAASDIEKQNKLLLEKIQESQIRIQNLEMHIQRNAQATPKPVQRTAELKGLIGSADRRSSKLARKAPQLRPKLHTMRSQSNVHARCQKKIDRMVDAFNHITASDATTISILLNAIKRTRTEEEDYRSSTEAAISEKSMKGKALLRANVLKKKQIRRMNKYLNAATKDKAIAEENYDYLKDDLKTANDAVKDLDIQVDYLKDRCDTLRDDYEAACIDIGLLKWWLTIECDFPEDYYDQYLCCLRAERQQNLTVPDITQDDEESQSNDEADDMEVEEELQGSDKAETGNYGANKNKLGDEAEDDSHGAKMRSFRDQVEGGDAGVANAFDRSLDSFDSEMLDAE